MKTICSTVALLLLIPLHVLAEATPAKPNVIVVMTDDQGYGDLACHGNPVLKTPNLDRLYAESVRFTDFHVSPFCTPTRAALMTGNHPGYTGAYRTSSGRTMMHPDEKTVGHLFAEAGYATGMVGKWHLGDNAPHRPQDRGFQDVLWHRCGGIGQASDYWGNDYFDDTYERATADNRQGTFEKFEGYCTDVWFREGLRFVENNRDKPFFLYLAPNAPHGPYYVAPEWAKPYQDNEQVANANFYGMVANIDHNMGILRRRLKELELADSTILIFMTDNGTAAGAKFQGLDSEPDNRLQRWNAWQEVVDLRRRPPRALLHSLAEGRTDRRAGYRHDGRAYRRAAHSGGAVQPSRFRMRMSRMESRSSRYWTPPMNRGRGIIMSCSSMVEPVEARCRRSPLLIRL